MAKPPKPPPKPTDAKCFVELRDESGKEMTVNVEQGESVKFVTRFQNSAGTLVTPTTASISLTYNSSGVGVTSTLALVNQGGVWTAEWDSIVADLGVVNWVASSDATTNPAETGKLRVINRVRPQPDIVVYKNMVSDYGAVSYKFRPSPSEGVRGTRMYGLNDAVAIYATCLMNFAPTSVTVNFGGSAFQHPMPIGFSAWGSGATLVVHHGDITLSGGNLTATTNSGASNQSVRSTTSHVTGKKYYEVTINALGSATGGQGIGVWNLVGNLFG